MGACCTQITSLRALCCGAHNLSRSHTTSRSKLRSPKELEGLIASTLSSGHGPLLSPEENPSQPCGEGIYREKEKLKARGGKLCPARGGTLPLQDTAKSQDALKCCSLLPQAHGTSHLESYFCTSVITHAHLNTQPATSYINIDRAHY